MIHESIELKMAINPITKLKNKLVNFLCIFNIIVFFGFNIYLSFLSLYTTALISFIIFFINLIVFLFKKIKGETIALFILNLANLFGYLLFEIVYGHISGGYLMIIVWLISVTYIHDNYKEYIPLTIIGILFFIGIEYYTLNYHPLIVSPDIPNLYYIILTICLIYLLVIHTTFRRIQDAYRDSISAKNLEFNKYFTAFEQSSTSIVITDTKGNIEYANPQFEKISGYNLQDVLGKNTKMFKSGNTSNDTYKELWSTIMSGKTWSGEFVNIKPNNIEYIEKANISPVFNEKGEIFCYIAIKEDITELKQTQEKLIESEAKYRFITEHTSDVIWKIDLKKLTYSYISPTISILQGYAPEELINQPVAICLTDESYFDFINDIKDALASGDYNINICKRYKQVHKNCKISDIEITATFIYDSEGNAIELLGSTRDVSVRVSMEKEILQKNEELHQIILTTQQQKQTIETINKEIFDSLTYARTLQDGMLTSKEIIQGILKEYFLYYTPKASVGGDFYYINKVKDKVVIAVADCTGHGVSGGFMSVLGIAYLHEILKQNDIDSPSQVLETMRRKIKSIFKISGGLNKNGMDIALCFIDTNTHEITYSGAYISLMIVNDENVIEFPATRNPVGVHYNEISFKDCNYTYKKSDMIYLFTDGIYDQFGGEKNKRYNKKRLKNDLMEIHGESLNNQMIKLVSKLSDWQQSEEQTDDITMLALRCDFH